MKGIADLLDSDMEDSTQPMEGDSILSSISDAPPARPTKAPAMKGRKKRTRVTMPAKGKSKVQKPAQTQKASPKKTAPTKRKGARARADEIAAALATDDQPAPKNNKAPNATRNPRAGDAPGVSDEHEQEEDDADEDDDLIARHASPLVVTLSPPNSRHNVKPVTTASSKKGGAAKRKGPRQARAAPTSAPPESEEGLDDEIAASRGAPAPATQIYTVARGTSRSRPEPAIRRRAGSASDTERGDPNLRRRLGDVTRKFENVEMKYRNLKEVGVNEANANVEKLRKQCDAMMQASNDLIASLKKELATQTPLVQEARKLKKQIQTQEEEVKKMRESATALDGALSAARGEIKALQSKLAAASAARAPPAEQAHPKPPSSTVKASAQRAAGIAAAEAAQVAQMKEELYRDLTGLIIRTVKRTEEGDSYDCIQTGRNGTLHFKLFVDHEDAKAASFEETEFLYTPLLDGSRDRDMIELMPSYLAEDITFARQNAAKFYGRVVDTLTKRRTDE